MRKLGTSNGAPVGARALVTSVVREAGRTVASGFVRLVDLADGRVLMTSSVPESAFRTRDPNPRGGLRGARGVTVGAGRLVVANTERLLVFETSWRLVGELGHPLAGGIHDILAVDDGVWVTATSADLLLKLGWDGSLLTAWEWRGDAALAAALGFLRLTPVDRGRDYRDPESLRHGVPNLAHLNAVSPRPGGLLVSLGRVLSPAAYRRRRLAGLAGWVARGLGLGRRSGGPRPLAGPPSRIRGSSTAFVGLADDLSAELLGRVGDIDVPNHNALEVDGHLVYNDSNGSRLVARPLDGNSPERAVALPGDPSFPRGLAHLGGGRFLVGNQGPLALYEVDLDEERIVARIPLPGEPRESAYGICLIPDSFDDPPAGL